jgi:cyclase
MYRLRNLVPVARRIRRVGAVPCRALAVLALGVPCSVPAQQLSAGQVSVSLIAPRFYLLSEPQANLVVYIDDDASLVAGVQSPTLVAQARELLRSSGAPPVRYALMMEHDSAPAYGDGGWGRTGSVTLAHEMLYVRMRRLARAAASGELAVPLQNDLPAVGFSHVVQLFLKNDDAHLVYERRGATDADVIVHFEKAGLLLCGNLFTSDGYPSIDLARDGSLAGMIKGVEWFINNFSPEKIEPIVPGRGPTATMDDLRAYHQMLLTVRDRVRTLQSAGKTLDDVISAQPTSDFDARWGRGPVSANAFIRMVYESLTPPKPPPGGHGH